ncbi:MAG: aminotransferase class V-fold PLP-dependent enzyme [Myxococcales bacterium]|nr:MAG: aminotransferase class V-fold PLP-dependent enzyme [Myxococcales bacterium]
MAKPISRANSENKFAPLWRLDPDVVYLNHGSFGACPKAVLQKQQALRDEMETQPVEFLDRTFWPRLNAGRETAARFVGADPDGLVFVANATTGVNAILRSLDFSSGDEILLTDHSYGAVKKAALYATARTGALVTWAHVPFPIGSEDDAVEAVLAAATFKTRLAIIDHVTSPTGIVLPVKRIVDRLQERGIDCLIDGAHAPGMLPLNIEELGAAYYTGNGHKWLCAPKEAGFLYVREDKRDLVHPLAISHGLDVKDGDRPRLQMEFDWVGTSDPTAWLCLAEAVRYMGSLLPGGWPELMETNRALALAARRLLADRLGVALPCPDSMIGTLAALPLPDGDNAPDAGWPGDDPLHIALYDRHRIEVPIMRWPAPPKRLVRISAQLYNSLAQYEALAEALTTELKKEDR